MGESVAEIQKKYRRWKKALHGKGQKIYVNKTKIMIVNGEKTGKPAKIDPSSYYDNGMQQNSIQSKFCRGWVHKHYSKLKESLIFVSLQNMHGSEETEHRFLRQTSGTRWGFSFSSQGILLPERHAVELM